MRMLKPTTLRRLDTQTSRVPPPIERSTKARAPIYGTPEWTRVRAEVLKEQGKRCHWCAKEDGRILVDHVVHVQDLPAGFDVYDKRNLVPSCTACNTKRGIEAKKRREART